MLLSEGSREESDRPLNSEEAIAVELFPIGERNQVSASASCPRFKHLFGED
ncbi:hypothetical protein [Trichocoleus sp. FACHB-591]|uniref:hypothetical protein n=1 Tax=Trichocoleus sp. FACHB-591 TaxID=2692872 RepID=UPI001A7E2D09|nr:hypothetical protein [Trichocoleus sp. FACHB-591]